VALPLQEATAPVGLRSRVEWVGVGGGLAVASSQDFGRVGVKVVADEAGGYHAALTVRYDYFVQGAILEQVVDSTALGDGCVSAAYRGQGTLHGILRGLVSVVRERFCALVVGGEVFGEGSCDSWGNWEWVR
jgi:hypothetical protein